MSLQTTAYTGGGSIFGHAREDTWGTLKTTGSDPNKAFGSPAHHYAIKEETFDVKNDASPQLDDLDQNREVSRVIDNGGSVDGSVRLNFGPDTIGYFLTMMFGTPDTDKLVDSSGSYDAAYQHVWIPGITQDGAALARGAWPAPHSFESRFDTERSKIILGALCRQLGIEVGNNAAGMLTADFLAKAIRWVQGADTSGVVDAAGIAKPCIVTANPTIIDEDTWHFKHIITLPTIDGVDAGSITSIGYTFAFPDLHGIFTAGGGMDIGSYGVDKFQASGRTTMLFEDETFYEKIKAGSYFATVVQLEGAIIQGAQKNLLKFEIPSAKAPSPGAMNKVGDLEYDFTWNARRDPVTGYSVKITLVNSVSSYAS